MFPVNGSHRLLAGCAYALLHLLLAVVFVHLPVEPSPTPFTSSQLIAHSIGDYVLQSHWMAVGKARSWCIAAIHAASYTLPFLLLTHSPLALLFIATTHAIIDHYRLARYVVWARNCLGGWPLPWEQCSATGAPPEAPVYVATWVMIIVDNVMHMVLNAIAIRYF